MRDELLARLAAARRGLKAAERKHAKFGEDVVEFQKQITALEIVLRDVLGVRDTEASEGGGEGEDPTAENGTTSAPSLAQAIREMVLKGGGRNFTVVDVRTALERGQPELVKRIDDTSIGGAISRLV